jgi:hypothetical protein
MSMALVLDTIRRSPEHVTSAGPPRSKAKSKNLLVLWHLWALLV